jgi:hypothetical protein
MTDLEVRTSGAALIGAGKRKLIYRKKRKGVDAGPDI